MIKAMSYADLKAQAIEQAETAGHRFDEWHEHTNGYGWMYGGTPTNGNASCIHCNMELWVDEYPHSAEFHITGDAYNKTCISLGRTIDPEGFAATTWVYCSRCGKKLNHRSKHEMTVGIHKRCQENFEGIICLDNRDMHQLYIWMEVKD